MKKLIAIVACLALVGSFSIAACAEAVSVGSAVEGMTTTYDKETGYFTTTVNANVGEQATILAFTGETLKTDNGTNIEFINQEAKGETTSFTYMMKSDVVDGAVYTVKIGGSDVETPYSQKITIPTSSQEPTTYTVSGSVNNFVETDFYDMIVEEGYIDAADLDTYKAAYGTTAYLTTVDNAFAFLDNYGDELVIDAIASCEVSPVDGTYSFTNLDAGEYAVVIYRAGALPYAEYVTVEDADVDLGALDIVLGDLIGAKDFVVDPGDVGMVVEGATDITDPDNFVAANDVAHDGVIDPGDLAIVVQNAGDITVYATELIMAYFS